MDTLETYDELPYDRLPLPETEPDFLAALARLHGVDAVLASRAHVLELGCAQGGNLIPMAARYPEGKFVGVDLSRGQVNEGQAFIERAGLTNIRLLHGDIAALPDGHGVSAGYDSGQNNRHDRPPHPSPLPQAGEGDDESLRDDQLNDLGDFDYIIAHGVYSWVPEFVREALLAACHRLLKPQGIAYISFNVEAGWKLYGRIREALLRQDDASLSPMQRVMRAKETLATMQEKDERIVKEIAYLKTASPSYLFHEYLSEINQPFSFSAFIETALQHGLRYLGESGPRRARIALQNDWGLSDEARHARWLEAEAGLDDALQTRFRRALLVRDDAPLPLLQSADRLGSLAFSAELGSEDELDFSEFSEQYFQSRTGERYPVSHPLLKACLVVLAGAWPNAVSFDDLMNHALPLAREYGYAGDPDEVFMEALLDFVQFHGLRLHTRAQVATSTGSELPLAKALARAQAASREWPVTTRFHQALDLDEWGRWLITLMNGKTPAAGLAARLAENLAASNIEASPQQAIQAVEDYVAFFRRQGIIA